MYRTADYGPRKPEMPRILNGNLIVLKWQNIHVISNIKHTATYIYSKTWPSSLHLAEVYSETFPTFKQGGYFIGGNYFHRKLHLRFLKRFWIPCCPVNHKNNQTASGKCKPHGNFKASYISVLNHWKIFETTLTTESNERNQITYLQS